MAKKKAARRKKVAAASVGLTAAEVAKTDSAEIERLAAQVVDDGGSVLGRYSEPFGGRPVCRATSSRRAKRSRSPAYTPARGSTPTFTSGSGTPRRIAPGRSSDARAAH